MMRPTAMTPRRIPAVATALAACAAISACGGGGGASHPAHPAAAKAKAPTAADARRAATLVAQAFAANPTANSGHIDGTITISVTGVPHFHLPITLTMVGRFTDLPGSALAEWDELLGVEAHGLDYGAGATSAHGKVYLNIGSTAFAVPQSTVDLMAATAGSARNGLMKVLGGFGLRPQSWVRAPQIVGNEQIDGTDVVHLSFGINPVGVFNDAGHFTQLLSTVGVSGLADLPTAISPAAQSALVHSVRARIALTLKVPRADRREVGGVASAKIDISLDVSEVGTPQTIAVQKDVQTWAQAIPLLDAAAFSKRPPGQRGE
jgi:hypothetical protein